jgi:hypothetical protein
MRDRRSHPVNLAPSTLLAAVASLVLVLAGACGGSRDASGDEGQEFIEGESVGLETAGARLDVEGYSFEYPAGWQRLEDVDFPFAEAIGADRVGRHVVGIDERNWIVAYTFESPVDHVPTETELDAFGRSVLGPLFRQVVDATPGGRMLGPFTHEFSGQPGILIAAGYRDSNGTLMSYELRQIFHREGGLVMAANAAPDHRQEVMDAFESASAALQVPGGP